MASRSGVRDVGMSRRLFCPQRSQKSLAGRRDGSSERRKSVTCLAPRFYADLIGKPFIEYGRGPAAYDCFGLFIEIQRRLGRRVIDCIANPDTLDEVIQDDWIETVYPKPGDGILIRSVDPRYHVATVLDGSKMTMVHVDRNRHVCEERFDDVLWARRILGFYTWKN